MENQNIGNEATEGPAKKQKVEDPSHDATVTLANNSNDKIRYHVLILGASYGSLLSSKLLLAGHSVTLVCRQATAALLNEKGSIVRIPIKKVGPEPLPNNLPDKVELRSSELQQITGGVLRAMTPETVLTNADTVTNYDLVVLAMQEPQYGADNVRPLMERIANAKLPVMAITNMPILPYLARIPKIQSLLNEDDDSTDKDALSGCFAHPDLWKIFDPSLVTQASPDPQAVRPPDEPPNVLVVNLASNFKCAPFAHDQHTQLLQQLEQDILNARFQWTDPSSPSSQPIPIQVRVQLRISTSLFVPMAKWAMLLTGNYRCIKPYPDPPVAIRDVVCGSPSVDDNDDDQTHAITKASSQAVYEWVIRTCVKYGAQPNDFVPFDKYHAAAQSLIHPSSAARALADNNATQIERIDQLICVLARHMGTETKCCTRIVAIVDEWLRQNRNKATQVKPS